MTTNNLFRTLTVCLAIAVPTSAVVAPVFAQDNKPAQKPATQKTTIAATQYECKECKLKFTAAEAKKKGFKCDCGCKLTAVKSVKKRASAKTTVHKTAAAKAHIHTTAVLWECQHCKEPMSYADAKKQGFHCCGMPMIKVAQAKHTATKKG